MSQPLTSIEASVTTAATAAQAQHRLPTPQELATVLFALGDLVRRVQALEADVRALQVQTARRP